MFAQIFDKLISDSESVRTMFDQLFEFGIRHVEVMNAFTERNDSSNISIEQLRSEKPIEPISYCPDFSIYTWDVGKVLNHIHKIFTEHNYPIYTFPIYLETHVHEIIKIGISEKPSNICLAALKYISVNPYHVALRTLNIDTEVFRENIRKCETLDDVLDVMISFNTKLFGANETFKDKFIHSLQQIIKLQNTWEYIKICNISNKLEGDKSIGEDVLFDIYGGDYSQIPKSTKIINVNINMENITQSSDKRINSFIYQNFNRFCDLLESYGKTVYKVLNNSNENDFSKEITLYDSKLDYYNLSNKSLMKMFSYVSSIKDKHVIYGLKDVVDVIIYNYIPELRKLKYNKYFDESLAISMITSGSNSMLLGVALYIPSVKVKEPTKEYSAKNNVITGGNTETDGVNSEILSTVNKFNESTTSFITAFLINYKKIIDKLEEINWNTLKVKADINYKNSFVLLRKLLIKKPETLCKLMDLDETDNFNYDYTKSCNEFTSFVRNNQLSIYSNITSDIDTISSLLSEIHKKVINFRNETFNIKKNKIDFDYLSFHTVKLQRELNLKIKNEFDKEKLEEKINKIIKYTLSSLSSLEYPYDISKNKEKLEEYLSKIKDRETTIKDYFETMKYDSKYSYQQLSPRVKNLVITFCNIYNALVNEYEKSYLWLNNEFDKFITKDRIKQMNQITLTSEQIKDIISAAEQIDKYKPLNNIAQQFDIYVSTVFGANVTDFYKCYQFIRNAYEEIGVLNYIEIIYKTLDIIDTSSKEWYSFKSNLLNFLTINSIWFGIYKKDNLGMKYILGSKSAIKNAEFVLTNAKFRELTNSNNNFEFFNIINNIFSNKLVDGVYDYKDGVDEIKFPLSADNVTHIKEVIVTPAFRDIECCDFIRFLFEAMNNLSINDKESIFKLGYTINDKSTFKPFNTELDSRIFKALYVPVFQKINKYIMLNKSDDEMGAVDDKIMLSMLGGVKQYGSSVYDYASPHQIEEVKFIEEYLPIYISGYTIISYYISYINELLQNSKIVNIEGIFKCSILNSIIVKVGNEFKIDDINIMTVNKYLKFINDICAKNKKKDTDLTKFVIESISSEFNSLLTLSKSLKPNELKSVDLYSEFDNLTNITDDIRSVIQNMRELYINNGFNYSNEYKNIMQRFKDEMKITSDKKAFFINCIEKLNGKHTNDTFNTKKAFIDLYYVPLEIVTNFWIKQIGGLRSFQGVQGIQDLLYKLYLLYGNKYHSLKELYTCVFDEFYKDLDDCIHHIINYKNFNDKAVEETQLVHDQIKRLAKEMKTEIDTKLKDINYRIDDKMTPYIPFIGSSIVKKYVHDADNRRYICLIDKNVGTINHTISFENELQISKITITDMIINFISSISQEKTIPLRMVELLKNSELNNNTFKLFPVSDRPLIWKKEFSDKGNAFSEDIIGAFSSIIIHKSLYNNDLGTDVNSQVYCNKLLSIINFSIQTLETMLNSLIPGKEYYNGYIHNLDQKMPRTVLTVDHVNTNYENKYAQINIDNNGIIVPKINAKKEISILINILKELYTVYAPRAKECEFLGGSVLTPEHYIIELIKLMNYDNNSFKLHFMNNIEKYQWVIPVMKKIDYDIKYSDPFERYFKNMNNMDKLIDKKDHIYIFKILAKLILYKFLNIDNIFTISDEQQIKTALTGGDKFVGEVGQYELTLFNHNITNDNINQISISKDIFNPLQYIVNDKVVLNKVGVNTSENVLLFGDNEYITSKVSQLIVSDDRQNVRRLNVRSRKISNAIDREYKIVKFNNGVKRSYFINQTSNVIYEILFDYNIKSEKIKEVTEDVKEDIGVYEYAYKNIKDAYEHIKTNGNNIIYKDYIDFIGKLVDNENVTIDGFKYGLSRVTEVNDGEKYQFLVNIFGNNDDIFDKNMMMELGKDRLILETINKRKLWLIAISILILYSHYGIWKNVLIEELKILSRKLINMYNTKYYNVKPCVFIDELIKAKTINYTFDGNSIDISTFDLIEIDTHYLPEMSKILNTTYIDNYINPIINITNKDDILKKFYALLKLLFYRDHGFTPVVDEAGDVDNNRWKEMNFDINGYISPKVDNKYIIYNTTFDVGEGGANDADTNMSKYIYDFIITSLKNIASVNNNNSVIYQKYLVIKMLYRIFKLYYSIMMADTRLIIIDDIYVGDDNQTRITDFHYKSSSMFKLFNKILEVYQNMLSQRKEVDVKQQIKNTYNDDSIVIARCSFIKQIYKALNNNIVLNFRPRILDNNALADPFNINLSNEDHIDINTIQILGVRGNDDTKVIINQIFNIFSNILAFTSDIIPEAMIGVNNKHLVSDILLNDNKYEIYKIAKLNYDYLIGLTGMELSDDVKANIIALPDIVNKVYNDYDNLTPLVANLVNAMDADNKEANVNNLKIFYKRILDSFNVIFDYCLKYNIKLVITMIIESRASTYKYFVPMSKLKVPYDNLFNNNSIKALNDVYNFLNVFDVNNIQKSINEVNKTKFTLMGDSQIEIAKKKLNILLSSQKHIKSLNKNSDKIMKFIPDGMYLINNILSKNELYTLDGANYKFKVSEWKKDSGNKWYMKGLGNNNIVIKTMIEILLESMNINSLTKTYQLHPFNNNIPLIPFITKERNDEEIQNTRNTLIYTFGDVYCNNNNYYMKHKKISYENNIMRKFRDTTNTTILNISGYRSLILSFYLMLTYENPLNRGQIRVIEEMNSNDHGLDLFDLLKGSYESKPSAEMLVAPTIIYDNDKLTQIQNILLNGNMSGGDLLLEDPNIILEKFVNEKHTIFDKYIFRYHSNIKNIILGHFANIIASYSNYLSGLTYYQILYSSEVFNTFVKNIRESLSNNNIKVQNSEISCIYHVINSLLSDELTERVKLPMIKSADTIGNELNNSNFIQNEIIYPFINKRKFFNMKSKDETLLTKLNNYNFGCLIDNIVDIEFYNMVVNCILIYIVKYVYNNKLADDTINYIDNEISL